MKQLSDIQSVLNAPKGQYNNFGKYSYRSCEDIVEAVKPLLSEVNASLTLDDVIEVHGDRVYVKSTASIIFKDGKTVSASAYAREPEERKGMDASQLTGSCSSYARKYALNGLLAIDDVKDADVDTTADKAKRINKELVQEYLFAFLNAIKNEDGMAMRELGNELKDTPEQMPMWKLLNSKQQAYIKKTLAELPSDAV